MEIIKVNNENSVQKNVSTGLEVVKSFQAGSGFKYISGFRKFGDLTIVESVTIGIGISYLNNIKVFNEDNELIIDKNLPKHTFYSREKARTVVRDELLYMLEDAAIANDKDYDRLDALEIIDHKLKTAFFKQSYLATLSWAQDIGIELTPVNQ